ncbi:MAG: hypothetical protein AAF530_21600 [Pseudomonadota bacterium]
MAPTIFAFFAERAQQKHLTLTIGLLNICGSLPALVTLWEVGHSHTTMLALLQDNTTWLTAYLFAAFGWVIYLVSAFGVAQYHRGTIDARLDALEQKQRDLLEAWGDDVITADARYFAQLHTAVEEENDEVAAETVVEPPLSQAQTAP